MRSVRSQSRFMLIAVLMACSSCWMPEYAAAEQPKGSAPAPPQRAPSTTNRESNPHAVERDRLWREANEAAANGKWGEAARLAEPALKLHRTHFTDQPIDACRMLETLAFWHTRARQFPQAMTAARDLEKQWQQIFGKDHWRSVDARLNTALMERLSRLTDEAWSKFLEADALHAEATRLLQDGKTSAALEKIRKALSNYEKTVGGDSPPTLSCLAKAVRCELDLGEYFAALPHVQSLMERLPRVHGWGHPETLQGLRLLARFNEAAGEMETAEKQFRKVAEIQAALAGPTDLTTLQDQIEVGRICSERGKLSEARALLVEPMRKQRELLVEEHPAVAQSLKVLGTLYTRERDFPEAEKLLNQSLSQFRTIAGVKHPATAGAYNARGRLFLETDRLVQAAADFRSALAICQETLGAEHPITAKVLENQARLHERAHQTGPAQQLRLVCLRIAEKSYGEHSFLTANALEELAGTHLALNDFSLAKYYLQRARETLQKRLGETHPQTAAISGQLGYACFGLGDSQAAEPLFVEALRVLEKAEDTESVAAVHRFRKWLALLYQSTGRLENAEQQYQRALADLKGQQQLNSIAAADVQTGLAQTLLCQGRSQDALKQCSEALRVYSRFLTQDDPHWIDFLGIAGTASLAVGDARTAERLLARGLRIVQNHMQSVSSFQSERQRLVQRKFPRSLLDLYLSLPTTAGTSAVVMYPHVLSWKGALATQQWRDRLRATETTAPLARELQQLNQRLATLTLRPPQTEDREAWILRIFEMNMRKEIVEQQLAMALGQGKVELAVASSPVELRKALPPRTALIDLLQYTHTSFETREGPPRMLRSERIVAFVLRPDRDIVRIDLGEAAPIAEGVVQWQKSSGFRPNAGKKDWGAEVGRLVWQPLQAHVGDCSTVLISPDGHLGHLAWNMLPGRDSGKFLVEEIALCVIPVPQLLPAMMGTTRPAASSPTVLKESLLLVGGVDYDASPTHARVLTAAAQSRGESFSFTPLPGTAVEIAALREQFQRKFPDGEVVLLDRAKATESAFRQEAPRHRWLHVATHGFFAPPSITSSIAVQKRMDPATRDRPDEGVSVFHVGFLNGLALAGANIGAVGEEDDGILTAAELATIDLRRVDVAVLSGCETGLGELHGGEGSFGLQRSLQIAGARSTIGSLWTVSDEKTSLLMQRFYANLWDKRLSRLEALREAQLWMLNTGGKAVEPKQSAPTKRCSPHYWAAFTLSGDWR